jgi:hypothetical protein
MSCNRSVQRSQVLLQHHPSRAEATHGMEHKDGDEAEKNLAATTCQTWLERGNALHNGIS